MRRRLYSKRKVKEYNVIPASRDSRCMFTKCMFLLSTKLFASMLMLNRHFQMQLFCWRFKDSLMTEVVAQDDTVTFE